MAVKRGLNKAKGLGSLFPQSYASVNHEETENQNHNSADEETKIGKNPVPKEESGRKKQVKKASSNETKSSGSASESVEMNDEAEIPENLTEDQEKATDDLSKSGKIGLNDSPSADDGDHTSGTLEIRISEIIPNKDQPRIEFDEAALDELTESIRQFGVIQPLLVQKKGKYYEIIAGERRWRAARKARLTTVPAVVRDYSEKETVEISLIENIQRQDLNSIEEAKAYRRLLDEFGMTQDEVAKRVSKSRTAVTNSVRLLNLEEHVQKMVVDGELSAGHARALLGLEESELQRKAAEEVVRGELSVRETELLVRELLKPKKEKREKKVNEQLEAVYHEMENRLTEQIGTKVRIVHGRGKRGKIEIEYYSQDDLNRIIDLIH